MTKQPIKLSDIPAYKEFIEKYETFLLDCDGVIWQTNKVFPGVVETLSYLRKNGKQILFVTNNAMKSRAQYLEKFKKLNIEAYEDEIFGSSYVAAYYIKNVLNFPKDKKVYVFGESGMVDELNTQGIRYCGGEDDVNAILKDMDMSNIKPDPEVGAVLCGFDSKINYVKLAKAFTNLHNNPNCYFILTNDDPTYPTNGGIFPGAGSLSAPLIKALDRQPDYICGKPNKPMLDCIMKKYDLNVEKTCMIGDRLNTDIQFGINGGFATLLVLTGISKESDILSEGAKIIPDYYMESFGDFSKII
ncbi:14634_t:CDS:2 [Entrophospora sp. SA101]|nr:15163_t:CDS:2 [Entrophospora sp. SA101]CAJ0635286.1 15277_t:CDS:2 [Entrophospora sp. SA101]CAJ0745049.1 13769_t:CDS:2 [Entrophospora sp. SA101]CAJ0748676.1 908_t:CDS:2 [Entrophospora sp. SA101]CAJ0756497.1 14634_t:CDS:2 [Entrophospora sp. SA101]